MKSQIDLFGIKSVESLSSNLLLSASVTVCQVFSLSKFENPHQSLSSNEQTVPSWAEALDKWNFRNNYNFYPEIKELHF